MTIKASEIDMDREYNFPQHSAHRRPYNAGGADRYYGRQFSPNFSYKGVKFLSQEMTLEQRKEYERGWDEELDRKEWR